MQKAATIDKVLDSIMKLDLYTQEMILDILSKRIIEERRSEIRKNAKQAKSELSKSKALTAEQAIKKLRALAVIDAQAHK